MVLFIQIAILAVSAYIIISQITYFPFPSPIAKIFLSPEKKWPTELVEHWIESDNPDASFVEFFNRDPDRDIPAGPSLVSPADGVLKGVYERDGTDHFTVGLSFWDVHVVRTPAAGIVQSVETEGFSLYKTQSETADFAFLKGKAGPVQSIVTIASGDLTFKVRLITSYWASRLKVFVNPGQELAKGQRIGRILLGSSVVVDLPGKCIFQQHPGERLIGGETIIADRDSCE